MRITVSGSYTYTEYDETDNLPSPGTSLTCPHCKSHHLHRHGNPPPGKTRYKCCDCGRTSYGVPHDPRPRCPHCKADNPIKRNKLPYNRRQYQCRACRRFFADIPLQGYAEHGGSFRHPFTLRLSVAANNALQRYIQATGLTPSAAVRAIFRTALDEGAFVTVTTAKATYSDDGRFTGTRIRRLQSRPEPPDPQAIAAPLPDLHRETAQKQKAASTTQKFAGLFGGVAYAYSYLDDDAKAGLLHAMTRTGLNHADTARLLIARAEPPPKKQENPSTMPKYRP